jgi:hypothetical protein
MSLLTFKKACKNTSPGAFGKRFISCNGRTAGTEVPSATIIGGGAATGATAAGAAIQEKKKKKAKRNSKIYQVFKGTAQVIHQSM